MHVHEFLEGVAQQDEAQDFELFAQGFGDRAGQDEDEVHDFLDEDQGEGEVDGIEVGGWRDPGQARGEQAAAIEFDADDADEEGHDLGHGHDASGLGVLPEGVQRIEEIGGQFVERDHGGLLFRGGA